MNLRTEPGFLGTNAHLLADITLLAYILLLLPLMGVGYMYARRKMFEPAHKYVMTSITTLNWVLILWVMLVSFTESVAPQIPDGLNQTFVALPAIHVLTGAVAQILATYLLARMWLEKQLPSWAKIVNIKAYMRVTLALWVTTAVLGIAIYFTWYGVASAQQGDVPPPVATDDVEPATDGIEEPVTTPEAADSEVAEPVSTPETEDTTPEPEEETPEPVTTPEPQEPATTPEVTEETEEPEEPISTPEAEDPATTPEASDS
ncbi:MAG: hypothetical protein AAF787_06965 [Chloroflexota bacterium]